MTDSLLHHHIEGAPTAPPLLLGPALGTSMALWDAVAPELSTRHRVIRWDLPGHGASRADLIGPGATVADLASLVLALADALGVERFAYAGVSLGGAVGLHLAVHHPQRITSLAMICSSAHFGAAAPWRERAELVRRQGTGSLAQAAQTRWFTPGFTVPRLLADLRATDPEGYAACCEALASYDLRAQLPAVAVPTLLIAGREDPATGPEHLREISDAVPGARLTELPGAAHLAPAERPAAVLAALREHLGPDPGAGMAVRRAVLGDGHVDRAQQRTSDFTARFQDFITRYAWGEIWTDTTLSRRERSMITLTALVAHGHHEELAMHVRAARRGPLSTEEIGAVLLQAAVYCGVPAANTAFGIAQRVLAEEDDAADDGAGDAGRGG
jgi:3-oxoadipate enol-lactonase/4-carboxymuconolactone decarboxylase